EGLVQKEEKFQGMFQTFHLGKIYSVLQKRGTEPNMTFARFKYLNQLIKHNNRLLFVGIPDPKEKKDIQLPSIFVMPRVKENVPVEDYSRLMVEQQGDDEFTGEEMQLRRMMMSKKEEEKAPVKFDKVFDESANPCFVVLGKPGSGKSTLLKYLMLEAARLHLEYHRDSGHLLFPILVEIRKLEHAFAKTKEPGYNILDFLYDSMRTHYNLTLPPGFFEKYLDSGRALLLFDGLDEVAAEGRRAEIRQMIASFVTGHHMGNTVIVTSRIAGYSRAQFSTTDYRHFTLEDFDDEEIAAFIQRWYRSRLTNESEAETKAADLGKAFVKKPRIKELARNPLLLTIIGIIHRYEAQLPEDRLVLYDKATEALLYTWDNVKEIIDEKFKPDDRRRFLEKVAFYLQSLEKGDEAGTVIDRGEVYKILFPDFCRIFGCDNRQAKGLVDEFLDKIRSRAGLLVELAPDRYGFVHKTFQEYFAARWIANEALLNFDLQIMIEYVDQFIDNAFWHETLLLAIRALPNKQAQKVLDHILTWQDPKKMEPYFYHHHYFVMKFIAEQGRWLGNSEFVEKQIDDFFRFSWNEGKDRGLHSNYTWKRFRNWVSSVSDSLANSILSEKLLVLAENNKQTCYLRYFCALTLGNLGLKDEAVAERLLHLAKDESQDGNLRRSCAGAVGKLGLKDKAVAILLHLAEDEKQCGDLRRNCAYFLYKLELKEKAIEILLYLVEDEKQEGSLRRNCAYTLGNPGLRNKSTVARLLKLVENEKQEGSLRGKCAFTIGDLGFKDKAVVERLLHLAEEEKQPDTLRRYCVEAVGKLGLKDKAVVERLLHLAEDEKQDGYLRCDCAEAIGKLGMHDKAVVERLLHQVEDEKQDGYFRRLCAEAMGKLGLKDKAVEILLNLAEDGKQAGSLRIACAISLRELSMKDKAMEIVLHLTEDEKQASYLRRNCAEALGNSGVEDKTVMKRLLHQAENEKQDVDLRGTCAFAVGKLGEKEKALDILISLYLTETDKYSGGARRIYSALWELTAV
ncbi:MAG: hypothetical protein QG657_749, partial [Acidobacteriota bacterium]|nr:hypothetical protein [Acidobacteriota bacterium]